MEIYFAAPAFTAAETEWNSSIVSKLEALGHIVWLPQRNCPKDKYYDQVYLKNLDAIKKCDYVVAILDRQDVDSGVAWKCGFARGIGKTIYGLRTDTRHSGDDPRFELNLMLSNGADVVFGPREMDHFWITMESKL